MSEHSQEEVNPNKGDGSTSDPNWRGDAADQGNDLRFAEEQQLINSQAQNADPDGIGADGVAGGYTGAQVPEPSGGYTGSQDRTEEGEYTDADGLANDDAEVEGEYTDVDSVPSLQEGAADPDDPDRR